MNRRSIGVRGWSVARLGLHRSLHTLLGGLQVQQFLILESQLISDLEERIVAGTPVTSEKHGPSIAPSNQGARQRSTPPRKRTTSETGIANTASTAHVGLCGQRRCFVYAGPGCVASPTRSAERGATLRDLLWRGQLVLILPSRLAATTQGQARRCIGCVAGQKARAQNIR